MDSLNLLVIKRLQQWLQQGQRAVLVTVTRTWGSSPRPIGSIMAINEAGSVVGSVSGGCIEDDLIRQYGNGIPLSAPQVLTYGLTADEAHRFGLPCGGTLELVLEFNPDAHELEQLLQVMQAHQVVQRHLQLSDGQVRHVTGAADAVCMLGTERFVNVFGTTWRLLLIGAGQLAEYVATMANFAGFSITVCDPRETYAGSWAGPDDVRIVTGMPDEEVQAFAVDSRTAVIALTHDPKLDDLALLEALQSPAFYVGAIGSRKNQAARRARFVEHFGITDEQLAQFRGPIGLPIGSKTPAEIAISVMAEVVAARNRVPLGARTSEVFQSTTPVLAQCA